MRLQGSKVVELEVRTYEIIKRFMWSWGLMGRGLECQAWMVWVRF